MELRSKLLSLILSALCLLPGTLKANEYSLPVTSRAMANYLEKAKSNIAAAEKKLTAIPFCEKNYENTLKLWNQLGNDILVHFSVLTYITEGSFPATPQAYETLQNFEGFLLQSLILNPHLQNAMLEYAETALGENYLLNPYENYQISCLLKSFETIHPVLSHEEQAKLADLQMRSSRLKRTPFLHLKGKIADKSLPEERLAEGFTVFDLNTCFLPGELVFVHGGMARWEERVSALAEKILETNADVICLQEVFTEEAGFALYERLKEHYSHFYISISPRPLGFSSATFGLPSGLFVASKYHVDQPAFTLFSEAGFPMNYGVFDFVIKNSNIPLGHIYTTHLQAFDKEQFKEIRSKQLNQLLEKIQSDHQVSPDFPHFLCGDLNIAWGSEEAGEALIHNYFFDAYNHGRTKATEADRTCTDYFSEFCFSSLDYPQDFDANNQIFDYALLYQPLPGYGLKSSCRLCAMKTTLVPMNSFERPEEALSDHHGLLTTIVKGNDRKQRQ